MKQSEWQKVTEAVNANSSKARTLEEKKWSDFKREAKKRITATVIVCELLEEERRPQRSLHLISAWLLA